MSKAQRRKKNLKKVINLISKASTRTLENVETEKSEISGKKTYFCVIIFTLPHFAKRKKLLQSGNVAGEN